MAPQGRSAAAEVQDRLWRQAWPAWFRTAVTHCGKRCRAKPRRRLQHRADRLRRKGRFKERR